ncbi:unnamed protein product [Moneuplotes crassus]|uniref:Uncharacterized protein n=1 Tax=Euplotes crassus TaxID=5936 RepID=A0AAD1XTZ4_EUPCR|nr:unnamed protein product [Moneuplotes crassus]
MLMQKSKNRLAEKKEKRGSMYPYPYKVQPERIPDIVEERKRSLDTISMPQMSRNRCPSRDDPDLYIKKIFGANFEFSEKYLTSKISSEKIIKAIKKRYCFKKVTRSTLKHILYEGARTNHILRMSNSCFEKMVDILNIDCESDEEDEKSPEIANNVDPVIYLKKENIKLNSSQGLNSSIGESPCRKSDGLEEKNKNQAPKLLKTQLIPMSSL